MIFKAHSCRKRNRRSKTGATIAEFGAAFYAFCIVIMLPTINLLSFALSYSYSFLCANGLADHVSQAISTKRAFQILGESASNISSDSLAQMLKISAGKDPFKLALVKSNADGKKQVVANSYKEIKTLLQTEEDTSLIQYEITAYYAQKPLLELGSVPFINEIPIIGKETTLSFKMLRHPEHLSEHSL